jgi:hypothetical protein
VVVTEVEPLMFPDLAVIVAVPAGPGKSTNPPPETDATAEFDDDHDAVSVRSCVPPPL